MSPGQLLRIQIPGAPRLDDDPAELGEVPGVPALTSPWGSDLQPSVGTAALSYVRGGLGFRRKDKK